MNLRKAVVVAVHPERRTVDLVFQDNGQRVAEVEVSTAAAGSDTGSWNVPSVPRPATEAAAGDLNATGRTLIALCAQCAGRPIVMGWTHPKGGQIRFTEQDREVHRHPSGAYTTVAPDGSIEAWHPSGAYLRIGTGPHQDLGTVAAGGAWQNPSPAPAPTITLATGAFSLVVAPDATATLTSPMLTLNIPHVQLNGSLTSTGDVVANGISLEHHKNTGVTAGGDETGPPAAS